MPLFTELSNVLLDEIGAKRHKTMKMAQQITKQINNMHYWHNKYRDIKNQQLQS